MNSVLNQYKVKFFTTIGNGIHNRITSINDLLSQVIWDSYTIYDANVLLTGISSILNNNETIQFNTNSLQVIVVDRNVTKLYEDFNTYNADNTITPYFTLPTSDFKVIVEEWRNYLLKSVSINE